MCLPVSLSVHVCLCVLLLIQIYLHTTAAYLQNSDGNVGRISYSLRIIVHNLLKTPKNVQSRGGLTLFLVQHSVLPPFF